MANVKSYYLMLKGTSPTATNGVYLRIDWWQEPVSTTKRDVYFQYYLCANSNAAVPDPYTRWLKLSHYFDSASVIESYAAKGDWVFSTHFPIPIKDEGDYPSQLYKGDEIYFGYAYFTTSASSRAYSFLLDWEIDADRDGDWTDINANGGNWVDGIGYDRGHFLFIDPDKDGVFQGYEAYGSAEMAPYYYIEEFEALMVSGSLTAGSSFNDEGTPSVSYSLPSSSQMSSAKVRIKWSGGYTSWKDLTLQSSGTYNFSLLSTERTAMRNAASTTNSLAVTYELEGTFTNGETFTDTWEATCTIINATPTLSPTVKDTRADAINITSNENVLIIGFSTATYAFNATALKGATITSYSVECGGQRKTSSTGSFGSVPSQTFVFTVTDSRGNTATKTITKQYVTYKELTCNIEVQPAEFITNTTARIPFYISGQYFNGKFGNNPNSLSVTYRYKIGYSGSYGQWQTVNPTISGNTYSTTVYVTTDYSNTVFMEVGVGDVLDYKTNTTNSAVKPVFDWSDSDFNFNVPVTIMDESIPSYESGTSGIWTYRKWADGIGECWGRSNISSTISQSWGNMYASGALTASNKTFPFTFIETPVVNASLSVNSAAAMLIPPGGTSYTTSTTQTGAFELARPSSLTSSSTFTINYYVRGRWK